MKVYALTLTILCLLDCSFCLGDDYLIRKWSDASGKFSIEAKLEALDGEKIQLRANDGRTINIKSPTLSKPDIEFIEAIRAADENRNQHEKIVQHLDRLAISPAAVIELVQQLHDDSETGVAAGLYSSCINSWLGDSLDYDKTFRTLNDVISRLIKIRKAIPDYQTTALISAYNNRAVMLIRKNKADTAAANLIQAAELSKEIPFVVYHNATLLLEVSGPRTKLELSTSNRTRLKQVVSKGEPEGPGVRVPSRFMYTYAHESFGSLLKPYDVLPKSKRKAAQQVSPQVGFELISSGSGFLIAPDLVLTNRHVVEGYEEGYQFTVQNETSVRSAISAKVVKVSKEEDVDLALLRVEQVLTNPLPLAIQDSAIGTDLAVLGYPKPQYFEETLTVSKGVVNKLIVNDLVVVHDAATNPGNSGGPCMDLFGNVIGVHFARSRGDEKAKRNEAVSVKGIRTFLTAADGYKDVALNTTQRDLAAIVFSSRDSVFMIKVWGNASQKAKEDRAAIVAQGGNSEVANLIAYELLPELTCLDCGGEGRCRCPNCVGGVVSEKRSEQVGFNEVSRTPVMGTKVYKKKCPNCNGQGGFKCESCNGDGRLELR